MFFSIESELPSGTRLKLQRDGRIWVAAFAAAQFVVRGGDVAGFTERARLWVEGNLSGASLRVAYQVIRHYAALVSEVDGEIETPFVPMRETRGGGATS